MVQEGFVVEETGKPAVVLVNERFLNAGRIAASKGVPGIRMVPNTVPPENTILEKARAGIKPVIGDVVAALTQPLTEVERSPKRRVVEKSSKIAFKGTLAEVNQFFYVQGWTDGLPIIPPTEEAVEEMLTGTDLPRDQVVAELEPAFGKATVEKIAVNAVMGGALPTYMPVLIAGVRCLADPMRKFILHHLSTGGWSPLWIINGPIRNELKINNGTGVFSPGIIANAAIGRTMGLIINNTAQARKGIDDMGHFGNPMRYTMVLAEDEERNPWVPLHVERGLNKEDNAVSLHYPHEYIIFWALGSDAKGILTGITANAVPSSPWQTVLVISPGHAKILAEEGWTKEEIKKYVSHFTRRPANHHISGMLTGYPKESIPLDASDMMRPLFPNPEDIWIVVGGGAAGNFIANLSGGHLGGAKLVTKKVELPANWEALVDKYKGMVPTYLPSTFPKNFV